MVSGRARGSEATAAREEEEVRWAAAGGREGPAAAVRGGAGGSDGGRWLHLRSSVAAPEGCNASRDDFQRSKRGEGEAPVGTAARDPKSLSLSLSSLLRRGRGRGDGGVWVRFSVGRRAEPEGEWVALKTTMVGEADPFVWWWVFRFLPVFGLWPGNA